MKRKWIKILRWVVLIYLLIAIALHFFQEKFIFHPKQLDAAHLFNFSQPFSEVNLQVNSEKTISIVQFIIPDSIRKGVVLYFHGNKDNVERYANFANTFTRNDYEVWMIDYPGFGKSTGERTEEILYEDAKLFYKLATSKFSKDSIIIYGKSIGTGIASYLASVRDCKQLILETPYTSMHDLMSHYAFIYPVSWMAKYHLPTDKYLEHVKVPITIIHGKKDEVIPFKFSKRLKAKYPSIRLFEVEKGKHNDLTEHPVYNQAIDETL
jgi:pimeloyl-ACP methyl ester carboxylesterase